jgi:hypothetical protein
LLGGFACSDPDDPSTLQSRAASEASLALAPAWPGSAHSADSPAATVMILHVFISVLTFGHMRVRG